MKICVARLTIVAVAVSVSTRASRYTNPDRARHLIAVFGSTSGLISVGKKPGRKNIGEMSDRSWLFFRLQAVFPGCEGSQNAKFLVK